MDKERYLGAGLHSLLGYFRDDTPLIELILDEKEKQEDEEGRDRVHKPGVLFAAGLITGEALMGIAIAIPIVVSSRADVLAVPFHLPGAQWIGLAVLFLVGWLIYRTGKYAKA